MTTKYDFVTGIETAGAPTAEPPEAPGDVPALGATTPFTIADNQASAASITGMIFDKTLYRAFFITYSIYRSASGGSTRSEAGILKGVTDGTNWEINTHAVNCPSNDDAGVDFSITSAGQVQYVSDANGGSYLAADSKLEWELFQLIEV